MVIARVHRASRLQRDVCTLMRAIWVVQVPPWRPATRQSGSLQTGDIERARPRHRMMPVSHEVPPCHLPSCSRFTSCNCLSSAHGIVTGTSSAREYTYRLTQLRQQLCSARTRSSNGRKCCRSSSASHGWQPKANGCPAAAHGGHATSAAAPLPLSRQSTCLATPLPGKCKGVHVTEGLVLIRGDCQ